MGKYKLCLIYSSSFYKPIIDTEFSSLREIDELTEQFKDETDFRNDKDVSKRIDNIKNMCSYYINKISDERKKEGIIGIIDTEKEGFAYVTPLYQKNNALKSPKKLANLINSVLKKEDSGVYLSQFLNKFFDFFNTEYNRINGIYKHKRIIEGIYEPETRAEKESFKKLLELIKITINHGLNKEQDTVDENKYFKYRIMYDYIKESKYIKNLSIKNTSKMKKAKLNQEKSKEIVNEEILYRRLMEKAYNDSLESGEEPNLLGIYKGEYKKELDELNWFFHGKRRK